MTTNVSDHGVRISFVPEPVPEPVPGRRARLGAAVTFDHERLDVYRLALEFVAVANDVVEALPRGRAYLADQLQRAATSIALNVAEGAGEYSKKDKARFYRMARRSATECAAIMDVCRIVHVADPAAHIQKGRTLLLRIVSMLVAMCRVKERTGTGSGTGSGTNAPEGPCIGQIQAPSSGRT